MCTCKMGNDSLALQYVNAGFNVAQNFESEASVVRKSTAILEKFINTRANSLKQFAIFKSVITQDVINVQK